MTTLAPQNANRDRANSLLKKCFNDARNTGKRYFEGELSTRPADLIKSLLIVETLFLVINAKSEEEEELHLQEAELLLEEAAR